MKSFWERWGAVSNYAFVLEGAEETEESYREVELKSTAGPPQTLP